MYLATLLTEQGSPLLVQAVVQVSIIHLSRNPLTDKIRPWEVKRPTTRGTICLDSPGLLRYYKADVEF